MHDHQDDIDINLLEEMGYEHRDVDVERISKSVVGFFVISTAIMIVGFFALKIVAPADMTDPKLAVERMKDRARMPGPDMPLIQSNATALQDQHDFIKSQREELTTYGWTDRTHGYVRIPVEDALKEVVAKGLPTRANPATAEETQ